MALIESGLRGFHKEARRSRGSVGGLKFEFGGSIKGNGAKSLCAIPVIQNGDSDRFIKGTQRGGRRNLCQEVGGIFFARAEFI